MPRLSARLQSQGKSIGYLHKKLAHLIVTSAERKHVIRHNNKPLFFLFGIRNKYFTRLKIDIPPVQLPSLLCA